MWSCQIFYCQLNYYSSFSIVSFIWRLEREPASRRTFMRLTLNWGKIYLSLLEVQGGETHHFIAGTQPSVQLYFLLQSVNKNTILQAPVFLLDSDNSLPWKQQTLAHCLEKCARRLSQREHSECLTSCLPVYSGFTGLKDRRPWLKGTERERTKRGEKWKMQVVWAAA